MTFSGFSGPIHFHADDTMKHQPHRKYYIVTTDPCIELCISVRAELPKQETHLCLLFPGLQEEHWDIMYVQQTKYTTLLRCQTQLATVHQSSRHVFVGSPRVSWQLQGTVCLAYHRPQTRDLAARMHCRDKKKKKNSYQLCTESTILYFVIFTCSKKGAFSWCIQAL